MGKYFKYAIGEILLVVIGILIALQINNWNEQRKIASEELSLLNSLYHTMDNNNWDFVIAKNIQAQASVDILIQHIEQDLPYSDSLDAHFLYAMFIWSEDLNQTAYDTAKQYGLNFIENDTTRAKLSKLYEVDQGIIDDLEQNQDDFHNFTTANFLSEHFKRINKEDNTELKPLDYDALMRNKKFEYILKSKKRGRRNVLRWQQKIMHELDELKSHLREEIKRYE